MLILASLVLVLVLKWNPIQWLGWVLAVFSGIYLLHMAMWGMNYYAGSLSDDIRLEVSSYNLDGGHRVLPGQGQFSGQAGQPGRQRQRKIRLF